MNAILLLNNKTKPNLYDNLERKIYMKTNRNIIVLILMLILLTSTTYYTEGFSKWPTEPIEVDPYKSWHIKFSHEVMESTINSNNIYVIDENGVIQSNIPVLESNDTILILAPEEGYKLNTEYTLYIKDIKSKNNKDLNQSIKMNFTIKGYNIEEFVLGKWATVYDDISIEAEFSENGESTVYASGLSAKGIYIIEENTMTMDILGRKLTGEITIQNDNQFTVTSPGGKAVVFKRAEGN